jgi:hypothetical protein
MTLYIPAHQCSPQDKDKKMGLGGAYYNIKAFGPTPFPHQRIICSEGVLNGPVC